MKKVLFVIVALFAFCMQGVAQKGMQGVGGNIGHIGGDYGEGYSFGLKYHYNINDYFRIEPTLSFILNSDTHDVHGFKVLPFIDAELFLIKPGRVRPFVFAGVGTVPTHRNDFSFAGETGLGADWRATHNLSFQIRISYLKCLTDESEGGYNACVGLSYNF